jgi:hypothetical protein
MEAQNQEFHFIMLSLLLSLGTWLSAEAVKNSADRLVGFFDIQDSNGVARYEQFFANTQYSSTTVDNATFLAMDVLHHTFVVGGYYMIALALVGMPHELIKYTFAPEKVELPEYNQYFTFFGDNERNLFPMMDEFYKMKM